MTTDPIHEVARLVDLCQQLAKVLSDLQDEKGTIRSGVTTWNGGTALYLECPVPDLARVCIDVCITNGRMYLTTLLETEDAS